jgi:hypothetical protein
MVAPICAVILLASCAHSGSTAASLRVNYHSRKQAVTDGSPHALEPSPEFAAIEGAAPKVQTATTISAGKKNALVYLAISAISKRKAMTVSTISTTKNTRVSK